MMITNPDEVVVTLDLASNRLVAKGQNFSLVCDKDSDLGERLRVVLQARAIERSRGFATNGAPSAEWQRHRFLHRSSLVHGCVWCDEKAAQLRLEAQCEADRAKEQARTMAQARKQVEARKRKEAQRKAAKLIADLGI